MERLALGHLEAWKDRPDRRPMVVRGARQVGKTFLARAFAKASGLDPVILDFEADRTLAADFEAPSARELLGNLAERIGRDLVPGRTLLVLDEIQAAPRAFTMLRYLYEQAPELHVLATGSLLELMLGEAAIPVPVGRVEFLHLPPMTIEETIRARGNVPLARRLAEFRIGEAIPAATHAQLLGFLREHLVLGGMPAVVEAYRRSRSLPRAEGTKRALLRAFEDDFGKYRRRVDVDRLRKVFAAAPRLSGQVVKYSRIDPDDRTERLKSSLDLLVQARLFHRVHASACSGVPLGAEEDSKRFKLLMLDSGLLATAWSLDVAALRAVRDLTLVQAGAVAEQHVGQELLASLPPDMDPRLHFWAREARGSAAEVDFVIAVGPDVVPIEVKAGKTGSLRSLHVFMHEKARPVAIRLNSEPPQLQEVEHSLADGSRVRYRLLSLPLYLAGQVRRLAAELLGARARAPARRR